MKTLGILGGMSAASTELYYRELCRLTRERLGGFHSPELLIRSLDFAAIEGLQAAGDWEAAGRRLNVEARALERGGADLLVLATNTMHMVAEAMMERVRIPFLHIADATAGAILKAGLRRPALMATAFTMEKTFYTERLEAAGLEPILPGPSDRAEIHRVIYQELCQGQVRPESEARFIATARSLAEIGADSLILGCTEIGLLVDENNAPLPVFDTTLLHCEAALDVALSQ